MPPPVGCFKKINFSIGLVLVDFFVPFTECKIQKKIEGNSVTFSTASRGIKLRTLSQILTVC